MQLNNSLTFKLSPFNYYNPLITLIVSIRSFHSYYNYNIIILYTETMKIK